MGSGNSNLNNNQYILLAEDDPDDCMLFEQAFNEVNNVFLSLKVVNDGAELMNFLEDTTSLPKLIFLDLNMPVKNGYECLLELKGDDRLKNIPVIIYSTSGSPSDIEKTSSAKAHLYITKAKSFTHLKKIIHKVLVTDFVNNLSQPPKENFLFFVDE